MLKLKQKKNIFNLSNTNFIYLMSFILPILILIAIYVIKGVFPFGLRSILRTDLYHQYAPFHSELLYKLQNFKSLFYTYNVGLGTNFLSLIAYYLSSPFNILLFILKQELILEYLAYMIVLKIGISSLTMSYYLTKRFKSESYYIIIFSIIYSLSGYMVSYYWNVMWLDCIWLFPLLIYGFENVFYNNKYKLYIITLALSILTNYYIATMICFFFVLYFVFLILLNNIKRIDVILKKLLNVFVYSLIGVLISSILLIPVFFAFSTTASSNVDFPKRIYEYFPMIDVITRMLPLVKVENGIDHWPNIYAGAIIFFLMPLYYLNKKINFREKISYSLLILFFVASFSLNYFVFVWHVFRYPNSLPARQSFIFIFIILVLSFKSFLKIKNIKDKEFSVVFGLTVLFLMMAEKVSNTNVKFESYYVGILFLFIYFVILLLFRKKNTNKTIVFIFALVFIVIETFMNASLTSFTTIDRNNYIKKMEGIKYLKKEVDKMQDDFYRIEIDNRIAKDDGAFYNYPSTSIFSSTAYQSGSDFYKKIGCEAATNAYSITGSTPFADSFFDVKYTFFGQKLEDKNAKELNLRYIADNGNVFLYENINSLPLSFVLENSLIEKMDLALANPATIQNNFARGYGLKPFLEKIPVTINKKTADFKIEVDGDYYVFVRDKSIETVTIQYPNTSKKFTNLDRGYFIELGYLEKGDTYQARNDYNDNDLLIEVFKFNYENLRIFNNRVMQNANFKMINFDDTHINYELDVKNPGKCMLTLPYDKGFEIYVDNAKVEVEALFDTFLSFDVSEGKHIIKVQYLPRGFMLGLVLSALGIISFVLLCIFKKEND